MSDSKLYKDKREVHCQRCGKSVKKNTNEGQLVIRFGFCNKCGLWNKTLSLDLKDIIKRE